MAEEQDTFYTNECQALVLDHALRAEEFRERKVDEWVKWIAKNWFESNDRNTAALRRALIKRLLSHHNWASYFNSSSLFWNQETIVTFFSFYYPTMFGTLLDVGEEFGMDLNGYGDGFYAAAWLINSRTGECFPHIEGTVMQCIDRTDDMLFKACHFDHDRQADTTIVGRLQTYMHNKRWFPIFSHLLLRAYDDRSGIDMLSELQLWTCKADSELRWIEQRQRQYQSSFSNTLREALENHALSDIGGVLNIIMSFSWTNSAITKYQMTNDQRRIRAVPDVMGTVLNLVPNM